MSAPRAYTIALFLHNEADSVSIATYKDIPCEELRSLIAAIFPIPSKTDIVGVYKHEEEADGPMIPLSYIANNPRTIDAEAKYQIITSQGLFSPQLTFLDALKIQYRRFLPFIVMMSIFMVIVLPFTFFRIPDFVLMHRPVLRNIYLNGPNYKIPHIADLGFWNGKDVRIICSELTGQSSEFWSKNAAECYQLYRNKENAFIILVEAITVIYFAFCCFKLFIKFVTHHLFS